MARRPYRGLFAASRDSSAQVKACKCAWPFNRRGKPLDYLGVIVESIDVIDIEV